MRLHLTFVLSLLLALGGQLSAIDASVSFARFLTPDGAYLELHTHIAGSTVGWKTLPGIDSLQGAMVDFTVILRRGEEIIVADRFTLNSPASKKKADFVDLKRYAVTSGASYELELLIADQFDPANVKEFKTTITVDEWPREPAQSDVILLAGVEATDLENGAFFRHGFNMEPLPHAFYGKGSNTLSYYNEIYSTDSIAGERVLLLSKIEALYNGTSKPVMAVNKVQKQAALIPHVQQLDISKLRSGQYLLAVEVRDEQNELVCRREMPFYRANPLVDEKERETLLANTVAEETFLGPMDYDSLHYAVLAILPLLPQSDVVSINEIVRKENAEALRMYLYSFWSRESPFSPEDGYRDFMKVADFVNKRFNSGFRYGFQSDRGYIFIKYGAPSDMTTVESDPTAPPYEVWSYNYVDRTKQQNRRFIFYNPSLAAGGFELLHSDVTGERNNPQWEVQLYRNASSGERPGADATNMGDNMGRNARRILSDF